jgi:hypothetical protein
MEWLLDQGLKAQRLLGYTKKVLMKWCIDTTPQDLDHLQAF